MVCYEKRVDKIVIKADSSVSSSTILKHVKDPILAIHPECHSLAVMTAPYPQVSRIHIINNSASILHY